MDDEEYTYQALQEPLYRIETGNYEYRLILRCRQEARKRFATLRSDVLVKLELLDQKHVQNITVQLVQFISALSGFTNNAYKLLSENIHFPIELDLSQSCLIQNLTNNETLLEESEAETFAYRDATSSQLADSAIDLAEEVKCLLANAYDDDHNTVSINDQLDIDQDTNDKSNTNSNFNLESLIDIFESKETTSLLDSNSNNLLLD